MIDPEGCHLVVWEARHDNGWITLVKEQPDGTFVAWAGLGEAIGVDYVEDTPEQAQAAAMFTLKRRAGTGECSRPCSPFEMRTQTIADEATLSCSRCSYARRCGERFVQRVRADEWEKSPLFLSE